MYTLFIISKIFFGTNGLGANNVWARNNDISYILLFYNTLMGIKEKYFIFNYALLETKYFLVSKGNLGS